MRRAPEGFALVAVLAITGVIAVFVAGALQDALFGRQLATTRLTQQRVFALAELGIADALGKLGATTTVADYADELHPTADATESVGVVLRQRGTSALATGFSAGRFVLQRYEIASTGRAARNAQLMLVQGVTRVLPAGTAMEER